MALNGLTTRKSICFVVLMAILYQPGVFAAKSSCCSKVLGCILNFCSRDQLTDEEELFVPREISASEFEDDDEDDDKKENFNEVSEQQSNDNDFSKFMAGEYRWNRTEGKSIDLIVLIFSFLEFNLQTGENMKLNRVNKLYSDAIPSAVTSIVIPDSFFINDKKYKILIEKFCNQNGKSKFNLRKLAIMKQRLHLNESIRKRFAKNRSFASKLRKFIGLMLNGYKSLSCLKVVTWRRPISRETKPFFSDDYKISFPEMKKLIVPINSVNDFVTIVLRFPNIKHATLRGCISVTSRNKDSVKSILAEQKVYSKLLTSLYLDVTFPSLDNISDFEFSVDDRVDILVQILCMFPSLSCLAIFPSWIFGEANEELCVLLIKSIFKSCPSLFYLQLSSLDDEVESDAYTSLKCKLQQIAKELYHNKCYFELTGLGYACWIEKKEADSSIAFLNTKMKALTLGGGLDDSEADEEDMENVD